ncbi:hypothetical protein PTT_10303 [Pyrenophora teres f. teres 0-1]|uniref:GINS subunit domain-containing protein n=1 Tax=Pyrenophora teres f. teres (strain 0-1) TaxID=861557 RepID=E3RNX9_PYRTT|nr:hypothetical protein PTT_10303 [Pyrenophora teres f. teres 0-1]
MLLEAASDDFEEPDLVRKLLRGLREVRMAKLRSGVDVLDAGGGKIAASREQQRKDRDREELENGYSGTADYDDDEMDMQ